MDYFDECSTSLQLFSSTKNLFESESLLKKKETVLSQLHELVQNWIQSEYSECLEDDKPRAHFVTFGSYRLGINSPGSDIDVLCIGPKRITRDRFFLGFSIFLKSCLLVNKIVIVEQSFVPLITFIFDGIEIDLIFASLNMEFIPEYLNLLDDKLLDNLSPIDVRCLNGSRVTDTLYQLIPNKPIYMELVVFLKFWAKQRCIHSNTFGFLSGIAINILCAHVCRIFPDESAPYLIHKFFHLFGKLWMWPAPVYLNDSILESWDNNKHDLMPILTPCHPCSNTSYAINKSTFRIIKKEFRRGLSITSSMFPIRKCKSLQTVWDELCKPLEFFKEFKIFFAIIIDSSNVEHHEIWKGLVTSKIRKLILQLEYKFEDVEFHPYTIPNHEVNKENIKDTFYIGVDSKIKNKTLDLTNMTISFIDDVKESMGDKRTEDMHIKFTAIFQKDLKRKKNIK
jgi:poly(A) polymerase